SWPSRSGAKLPPSRTRPPRVEDECFRCAEPPDRRWTNGRAAAIMAGEGRPGGLVRRRSGWILNAALLAAVGCGDGGGGPGGDNDGQRLASQFERLADSVDSGGYSPTADALRHAAEIVRLTGHATPVTLTIDGVGRSFLAVAEQLDFPNLVCSWPSDSGVAPPGDTVIVEPGDSGSAGAGSGSTGSG